MIEKLPVIFAVITDDLATAFQFTMMLINKRKSTYTMATHELGCHRKCKTPLCLERRLARDLNLNTFYGALFCTNSYKNYNKVSKGL